MQAGTPRTTRVSAGAFLAIGFLAIAATCAQAQADRPASDPYPARRVTFAGGVTGLPDVTYATLVGYRPLKLDLYLPDAAGKPAPLIIFVHGGGWTGGTQRLAGTFQNWPAELAKLAARGYVVASVTYRLSGEAPFPAAVQDVKTAVRWLRANRQAYGIDGDRVLIWGASAGGQLAALVATSCGVAALEPPAPPPAPAGAPAGDRALPDGSDCVQGAITWYPVTDFETLDTQALPLARTVNDDPQSASSRYLGRQLNRRPAGLARAASPVTYVDAGDPPFLLLHGAQDKVVPPGQSLELHDRLRASGVQARLVMIPGVDHSFSTSPDRQAQVNAEVMDEVAAFIDATIGPGAPR